MAPVEVAIADGLPEPIKEKLRRAALIMVTEEAFRIVASNDPSRLPAADRTNLSVKRATEMYTLRNAAIYQIIASAAQLGWPHGFRQCHQQHANGFDDCWPVAYVEPPGCGQLSWHLPPYGTEWDGHDNAEKYRRIETWLAGGS